MNVNFIRASSRVFSDTPITERMFFLQQKGQIWEGGGNTGERNSDLKQQEGEASLMFLSWWRAAKLNKKKKNFAWKVKSKGSSTWSRWHSGCKTGKARPNRRLRTCFKQTKAASYPLSLMAAGQSQVCRLQHQTDTWLSRRRLGVHLQSSQSQPREVGGS